MSGRRHLAYRGDVIDDQSLASKILPAKDAIALGVLGDLVGYHLRRASSAVALDFDRALAGTGMRQVLFAILSVLQANPGVNQGAVGRALGIARANMVTLIDELVDGGLINRQVSASDRRAFSLTLTARGEAAMRECEGRILPHEGIMLAGLSVTERLTLVDLLKRIEAS